MSSLVARISAWLSLHRTIGFALSLSLLIISILWQLTGSYLIYPYVRLPGQEVSVLIDCVPDTLSLETIGVPLIPLRQELRVVGPTGTSLGRFALLALPSAETVRTVHAFTLSTEDQNQIKNAVRAQPGAQVHGFVEFQPTPFVSLTQINITASTVPQSSAKCSSPLKGEELKRALLSADAEVTHYVPLQTKISDSVFRLNGWLSEVVLIFMVASLLWLTFGAALATWSRYGLGAQHILNLVDANLKSSDASLQKHGAVEFVKLQYAHQERRLSFARVMGPTLGFVLTVSSLIAGLHPASRGARDAFALISSLQIALTATLIGLLIRVVAEVSLRQVRGYANKKLFLLAKLGDEQ